MFYYCLLRIESSWVDSQVEQIMLEYSLIYNNVAQFVTSEEQRKRIKPDTLKVEPGEICITCYLW